MTKEELERRRPLWAAMSDLFLDTEVRWNVPHVARACAQSGFDAATLERIFWVEVFPEAIGNLLQVAGEWTYLVLDEAALVRRAADEASPSLLRAASGWMVEKEWRAALALAPWLMGPEAASRTGALDVIGHRYFEEPEREGLLTSPERARAYADALPEAWARYEPLCRELLDRGTPGHELRAAAVERLIYLSASR